MSKDEEQPSSAIELLGKTRNQVAYENRQKRLKSACHCYRCGKWREGDDRGVLGLCEACSGGWLTDDDLEL